MSSPGGMSMKVWATVSFDDIGSTDGTSGCRRLEPNIHTPCTLDSRARAMIRFYSMEEGTVDTVGKRDKKDSKGKDRSRGKGKHERTVRPSEADRIEKGRRLAADYLVHRDGMDPQVAMDIVESMDRDSVDELITESATDTIERTKKLMAAKAAGAGPATEPDDDAPVPDFLTIPLLAEDETFAYNVQECARAANRKNEAEKEYKERKGLVMSRMKEAATQRVWCMGIRLAVYVGHNRRLDEHLLLEAGVNIDTINRCWKDTPYDDVRLTYNGGMGGAK